MKYTVIQVSALLSLTLVFGLIVHDITLDHECDSDTDIHYAVLLMIQNVNGMIDTCTGAIYSPSLVVTTGFCCHSAHVIRVYAFYSFTEQRWKQKRVSKATSVLKKDPNVEVGDELCVITLRKPLDLTPIDSNVSIFNDHLNDNSVLDIIVFLRTSSNNTSFKISCRLAESEGYRKCANYYRTKLNQSVTWYYCITNGFTWEDSCVGTGGAVIQHKNEILGVAKEFLESCNTAQYTFYHELQTPDNERFINMVGSKGGRMTKYYRGGILRFALKVVLLKVIVLLI